MKRRRVKRSTVWFAAPEELEVRALLSAVSMLTIEPLAAEISVPRKAIADPKLVAASLTVTNLSDEDGSPANSSKITLSFTGPVVVADASRLQMSGMILFPAKRTVNIPILSVQLEPGTNSQLEIITGVLVPKGATLNFGNGLATAGGVPLAVKAVKLKQGLLDVDFTMANRPFRPTNINLFSQGAYPNATIPTPTSGVSLTEVQARQQLLTVLNQFVKTKDLSKSQVQAVLLKFDAAETKAIIPEPELRAGLLSLTGTVARDAINAVLTADNSSGTAYSALLYDENVTAGVAVSIGLPNGLREIHFNMALRGTSIQAMGALMTHEVMHQDDTNSQQEEIFSDVARAFTWYQFLARQPSLSAVNSAMIRSNNSVLLAMVNSGDSQFPGVGIKSAPQVQTGVLPSPSVVFVGGLEFRSLDNYVRTSSFIVR